MTTSGFQSPGFKLRAASAYDVPAMARLRALRWGEQDFWEDRIARYLAGEHHPQHALAPRIAFVAMEQSEIIGFIAGHLTRRYDCGGELEWIDVHPEHRGRGAASGLLRMLADWFAKRDALRVCVNVDTDNLRARGFYFKHGAEILNEHWLMWNDMRVALHSDLEQAL